MAIIERKETKGKFSMRKEMEGNNKEIFYFCFCLLFMQQQQGEEREEEEELFCKKRRTPGMNRGGRRRRRRRNLGVGGVMGLRKAPPNNTLSNHAKVGCFFFFSLFFH